MDMGRKRYDYGRLQKTTKEKKEHAIRIARSCADADTTVPISVIAARAGTTVEMAKEALKRANLLHVLCDEKWNF
jgi:hypothetical protein